MKIFSDVDEISERGYAIANGCFNIFGYIPSRIFIFRKDGSNAVIPYHKALHSVIVTAIKEQRQKEVFDGLCWVSECWFSTHNPGEPMLDLLQAGVLRPRQDPDRKERVVIVAFDRDGNQKVKAWTVDRRREHPKLGKLDSDDGNLHGWLLEAFK